MKWKNLEQEARNFNKLRMIKTNNNDKVLTTRRFLAGHALSGIIARSPSWSNKKDVVREAYEWADKMLEEG